ncbi:class I glutamine amidotransferase-like protein [Chaetomium tenue]|uniref:Class I glutamine amidotransferase-like protein n=1 Tax=Chaetomium tenue TaxID=1854479 RepID=A0ACB7PDD0_9PEZI|nr:class I glutamine amidotransferase-like protein [Chaetomium globosum]
MTLKSLLLRACTLLPLLVATSDAQKNGSMSIGLLSFQKDIDIHLISHEIGLVKSRVFLGGPKGAAASAPQILATHSFENPPPLDVLLIPGGILSDKNAPALNVFIAEQYPKLEYLLSVCTGARNLADAGVLEGKRATSNKAVWDTVITHGKNVTWVPTARWVTDGNIWTSSGVAAGIDMMYAFLAHYYSDDEAGVQNMINGVEYAPHTDPHWDPFSIVHNALPPFLFFSPRWWFRAQMQGSVNYVTKLAVRFSELDRKYTDVCRDLERERVAARATQQSTEKLEAELNGLKEATVRSSPWAGVKNGGSEFVFGAGGCSADIASSSDSVTVSLSPPVSYAARAATSQPKPTPPAASSRPRPTFGTIDKQIILINTDGHRIDMPLPPRSATVAESFNRKTLRLSSRLTDGRRETGDAAQTPWGKVP